ncbi:hypothetical protein BHE74_00023026 [Ensete ventricosum]|nr:hypothetical protein BHE74_00023026 [Ensete ventricosum]RZS00387.1 hypothetical protein BHM03_00030073 [Ensete ventricosum]
MSQERPPSNANVECLGKQTHIPPLTLETGGEVGILESHHRTIGEPSVRLYSDSTNSLREQLCQVNQRLDEVHKEFIKSKEELGESSKGDSPYVPKIQDKPIPTNFRLPSLEYDDSTNPAEHVAIFQA